jgi:predicted ATPase
MERGVEAIRATGAEMGLPYFLGLLGETLAGAGQYDRALEMLDKATSSARLNGTHLLLSEIVRTKAEVLAEQKDTDPKQIEELFRSAIAIATRQNAPLPALRAATGWARALRRQGRRAEARAILEPYAPLLVSLGGSRDAAAAAELV